MESYASREATLLALESLGFVKIGGQPPRVFLDSPKEDKDYPMPVVQISIYQCRNGYWCVDVDGGFMAPCVWSGPRADWDKSDPLVDLIAHLDTHHPGWR